MSEVLRSIKYHQHLLLAAMPYSPTWYHHLKWAARFTRVWRSGNTLCSVKA